MKKHMIRGMIFIMLTAVYLYSFSELTKERAALLENDFMEYTLPSALTGPMALEFKGLTSDFLLFKFMAFLGGRIGDVKWHEKKYRVYMTDALDTITDLDPYYFDAYLFTEMLLAWQAGEYEGANKILSKGNQYINDDYRIPYYIGFNYYYFLKDNANGSKYLMEASKLPGCPYYLASLAARLSVYAYQHRVGIGFLEDMIKNTRDPEIIEEYKLRIKALEIMDKLEHKVWDYYQKFNKFPKDLQELVTEGLIDKIPEDPYGGTFYINNSRRVYTTSKMLKQ